MKYGMKVFGPAYTICFEKVEPNQEAKVADYIDEIPIGGVIVLVNAERTYCTVWGDILTYVAQKKACWNSYRWLLSRCGWYFKI